MPALFERAEGWEEGELGRSIDAVAIDSRDRTKSKGYVLPVMFEESMTELVKKFPADVQEGLEKGMEDPERYKVALEKFKGVHNCPIDPRPKEYLDSMEWVFGSKGNPAVIASGYVVMS